MKDFDPFFYEGDTEHELELRKKAVAASLDYFRSKNAPKPFIPGKTMIPPSGKVLFDEDLSSILNATLDMWLTAGRFSNEVESKLHERVNPKGKAILVNSGSSANLIAISSMGSPLLSKMGYKPLQKGDEVITVAAGFPTTVSPIIQNGWIPVFVDVDEKTLNALPEKIESARSSKTRAVVLAHTLGNPFRADLISKWCEKEGLYLVEDSCDALGATIGNQTVGSFGHFATLSFYPAHHITSGEGGAVITQNAKLKRVAESLRDWGRDCWCEPGKDNTCGKRFAYELGKLPCGYDHKYTYSQQGYNLKVTDMQAAILWSQLNHVDEFIEARRNNWKKIYAGIKSSPILNEFLQPIEPTEGTNPSWFGFPLYCHERLNREKLTVFLNEKKVGTRLIFAGNLLKQPSFENVEYRTVGEFTATDRVMNKAFWVATYPGLDDARIQYMLEQLEAGVKAQ